MVVVAAVRNLNVVYLNRGLYHDGTKICLLLHSLLNIKES